MTSNYENRLRKISNDQNHHFLALYQNDFDHKILGYVHAEIYEEIYADPSLNVLALAVSSDSQKSGIGTQLYRCCVEFAGERLKGT
ncbi:GNAT family N-acetyltransferase [Leuconostoc citreum]|uniref:GNAT family N-acetyltransferase n=1 Tax=Leuconostoc citreum TaxID=33964 RepID=UPI001FA89968|nr:GNAT family N-acetyltransferase [Leuconostoc citreum]